MPTYFVFLHTRGWLEISLHPTKGFRVMRSPRPTGMDRNNIIEFDELYKLPGKVIRKLFR